MELNLETKQQLGKLLAKPVLVTAEHIPLLQNLIKTYPYYQPLYLLLAKAGFGTDDHDGYLAKAALYNNGNILHQIIHEPQKLKAIPDLNVINYEPWSLIDNLVIDEGTTTSAMQNVVIADTINEDLEQVTDNVITSDNDTQNYVTNSQDRDENTDPIIAEELEPSTLDKLEIDTVEQVEEEDFDENDTKAEEPEKPTEEVEIQSSNDEKIPVVEHIEEDVDENNALTEIEDQEKTSEEVEIQSANDEKTPVVEHIEEDVDENNALTEIEDQEKTSEEVEIQSADNENAQADKHIEEKDFDENNTPVETEEIEKPSPAAAEFTENNKELYAGENTTPFVLPEIENLAPLESELLKIGIVIDQSTYESFTEQVSHPLIDAQEEDQQETLEEVGKLAAKEPVENTVTLNIVDELTEAQYEANENENTFQDEPQVSFVSDEADSLTTPENKIEELAIENIANTDFFAFESNLSSEAIQSVEEEKEKRPQPVTEAKTAAQNLENIVSKYDDDKLPFTFVWWLQKTRKDHEQIFRPFVSTAKSNSPIADLQQQYVENIFHLQSPLDVNTEEEPVFNTKKPNAKGNELVDKFIKDDPQIKVPKPDQINNINKAKKSAVDNYDVVSETLADIYIEQMLYHKAIDTYQKLSLKFPEKSRYFADLIISLEKKI